MPVPLLRRVAIRPQSVAGHQSASSTPSLALRGFSILEDTVAAAELVQRRPPVIVFITDLPLSAGRHALIPGCAGPHLEAAWRLERECVSECGQVQPLLAAVRVAGPTERNAAICIAIETADLSMARHAEGRDAHVCRALERPLILQGSYLDEKLPQVPPPCATLEAAVVAARLRTVRHRSADVTGRTSSKEARGSAANWQRAWQRARRRLRGHLPTHSADTPPPCQATVARPVISITSAPIFILDEATALGVEIVAAPYTRRVVRYVLRVSLEAAVSCGTRGGDENDALGAM